MSNRYPPSADVEFTNWVTTHANAWDETTVPLGLTPAQKAAYALSATNLTKKWAEYQAAKAALSDAHDAWTTQKRTTRALTMEDLGIIRRFALTQPNPLTTYNAAQIPAPKTPADGVPPGQPFEIKATLNTVNGNLKLLWKCVNPTTSSGTVYIIKRRVGTSGAWTQVGLSSTRSFTDVDVPTAAVVQYQVTAQRSNVNGLPSQAVSVAFGHGADGQMVVTSVKMAA